MPYFSDEDIFNIINKGINEDKYISPPGDTIKDILKIKNYSIEDFAAAMMLNIKEINFLLCGDMVIDEKLALKLSFILGSSANFWINREKNYREELSKIKVRRKR